MYFYRNNESRSAWNKLKDYPLKARKLYVDHLSGNYIFGIINEEGIEVLVDYLGDPVKASDPMLICDRIFIDFDLLTNFEIDIRIHAIKCSEDNMLLRVIDCFNFIVNWEIVDGEEIRSIRTEDAGKHTKYSSDPAACWNLMIENNINVYSHQQGGWIGTSNNSIGSALRTNPKRAVTDMFLMKSYSERPELLFGKSK